MHPFMPVWGSRQCSRRNWLDNTILKMSTERLEEGGNILAPVQQLKNERR